MLKQNPNLMFSSQTGISSTDAAGAEGRGVAAGLEMGVLLGTEGQGHWH